MTIIEKITDKKEAISDIILILQSKVESGASSSLKQNIFFVDKNILNKYLKNKN
jgi:hypothetical protein